MEGFYSNRHNLEFYYGHHYSLDNKDWAELIPPWGHLWMNKEEMLNYLRPLVGEEKAEKACSSIYDCKRLNRLTRKEYL